MFKAFNTIKNTGRYCDENPGSHHFEEKTVVYGTNGLGKSTLTAIFRSLKENLPKHIKERKTFGSTNDQEVKVRLIDSSGANIPSTYSTRGWDVPVPDIEIFDTKFIAQNVFDGEDFQRSHSSSMHEVVVGEAGKALAKEVGRLNAEGRSKLKDKTRLEQTYKEKPYCKVFTIQEFIDLPEDLEIDQKLEKARSEKEFAESAELNALSVAPITLEQEEKDTILKAYGESHATAKAKIQEHIEQHWKDKNGRKEFLSEGKDLMEDSCPFCGQNLEDVNDLIEAYKTFFDEDFKKWQDEVQKITTKFERLSADAVLNQLEKELEKWKKFLPAKVESFENWLEENKKLLKDAKADADTQTSSKRNNLTHDIDQSILDKFLSEYNALSSKIEDFNSDISQYKLEVGSKNAEELKLALEKLEAQKARHAEDAMKNLCTEYQSTTVEIERLREERDKKLQELQTYSSDMFSRYQTSVNQVLQRISADFEVVDLVERTDRRSSDTVLCGFGIQFFDSHKVEVLASEEDGQEFTNTLSQADRNSLAFAFYIAKLQNDPKLLERILIFDDPISSFDHERKHDTIRLLAELQNKDGDSPQQIIFLTHDKGFISTLHRDVDFKSAKYLAIRKNGKSEDTGCKQSKLVTTTADEILEDQAKWYRKEIAKFVNDEIELPAGVYEGCRTVLEEVFRSKYYLELQDLETGSLNAYVERLKELGIYDETKASSFRSLINKVHEPHHAGDDGTDSSGDVKSVCRETLDKIKEI